MKPQTIAALALVALTSFTAVSEANAQAAGGPRNPAVNAAVNNPNNNRVPPTTNNPEPVVQDPEVCFYTGKLYKGASFCTEQKGYFKLSSYWRNKIRSMTIKHAVVKACTTTDLKGECHTYSGDTDQLSAELRNAIKVVTIQ